MALGPWRDFYCAVALKLDKLFCQQLCGMQPPVLWVELKEVGPGKFCADITGAVRELATQFLVIIDASPNSLPPQTMNTRRVMKHVVAKPLSRAEIESVAEFQEVLHFLAEKGLAEAAWKVIGGVPVDYAQMSVIYREKRRKKRWSLLPPGANNVRDDGDDDALEGELDAFLYEQLCNAMTTVNNEVRVDNSIARIIELYQQKGSNVLTSEDLEAHGLALSERCKVFRQDLDKMGKSAMIVPVNPTVALLLPVYRKVGVRELWKQVKQESQAKANTKGGKSDSGPSPKPSSSPAASSVSTPSAPSSASTANAFTDVTMTALGTSCPKASGKSSG